MCGVLLGLEYCLRLSAKFYRWMQSHIAFRSQRPVSVCSVTFQRHQIHASFIGPRGRATTCLSTHTVEEVTQDSNDLLRSCRVCKGTGRISQAAGGYHKRNPVTSAKIVGAVLPPGRLSSCSLGDCLQQCADPNTGTKWTARDKVLGWRHFTVTEKRKTSTADYALLVATCDGSAMLWVRDWWHSAATNDQASSQAGRSSCSLRGSCR